jgi:hypothetical protein
MITEIKVGCDYPTNRCGLVRVIEIENPEKILVKFHNTRHERTVRMYGL